MSMKKELTTHIEVLKTGAIGVIAKKEGTQSPMKRKGQRPKSHYKN